MSPRHLVYSVLALALFSMSRSAMGLTVTTTVSASYVKDHPKEFSVQAEKRDDGLIHFTITHTLDGPRYLVATTEIRIGGKLILQTAACSYAREESATYYLTVAPDQLADTKFELFQGAFAESGRNPAALPGGIDFQIQLADFVTAPAEAKTSDGPRTR
jgi:hypothetical protein